MKLKVCSLFALAALAVFLLPHVAFAQTAGVGPSLPTSLTPATVTVALLAALVAFLTNAYNTGKFFGLATVPVTALPYIGVGGMFVTAVYTSLAQANSLSALALFNAGISGFLALLGSAGGAGAHAALGNHFEVAKMTKMRMAMKGGQALSILGVCFLLGSTYACQGCTKAQGTEVETVAVNASICVMNHFSDPPEQIAAECGLSTVQEVISILDAAKAMHQRLSADAGSVQP